MGHHLPDLRGPALLLAEGYLATPFAKTTHALLRGPSRFEILGVVDSTHAEPGRPGDAGDVLSGLGLDEGLGRGIPVYAGVEDALRYLDGPPESLVVGVAVPGGALTPELRAALETGARHGMTLVNCLHQLLTDDAEIVRLAEKHGARLVDVRKPPPVRDLAFWSGEILDLAIPRVPVLGIDCAVGKRTTATLLHDELGRRGLRAEMVTTGQTGWMMGYPHGFILDATANDFVSGELERAVLGAAESDPDVILIEGQSSLRNPSGPCGAELLLSAAAAGAFLQVVPGRPLFKGSQDDAGVHPILRIPDVRSEVELIRAHGVDVWGIGVHTEGLEAEAAEAERARLEEELGMPAVLPLSGPDAIGPLADVLVRELGL